MCEPELFVGADDCERCHALCCVALAITDGGPRKGVDEPCENLDKKLFAAKFTTYYICQISVIRLVLATLVRELVLWFRRVLPRSSEIGAMIQTR